MSHFKPNLSFSLLTARNQQPHHSTNDATTSHTSQYSVNRSIKDCANNGRHAIVVVIMQSELEETTALLKTSQEHLVKAMADVARVSDELLHCQQLHEQADKQRQLLETQLKDAEAKLDAVQTENAYTSKKIVDKLEQRVRVVVA